MLRRDFLFGVTAIAAFAGKSSLGATESDNPSLLNKGFAKTSLGAEAYFEVHGNPRGPDLGLMEKSRIKPSFWKLRERLKRCYNPRKH